MNVSYQPLGFDILALPFKYARNASELLLFAKWNRSLFRGLKMGVQVKPPEKGSPWLIRQGACDPCWHGTALQSLLSSSLQSNASHLLLMLFPLAHLQTL